MKRLAYFLICIFLLTGSAHALSFRDKEEGIINLDSATLKYDFGSVDKDKVVKKTIKIRNKLDEEIEIKGIGSTCECTSINVKEQKVKRNGIFEAEITFDSSGLSDNQYLEEVVYILTASAQYELIRVVVLVKIGNSA
ncbi:MAG: DUF1573 domain-containing protein [Candidatus Omnitrophica bacterium]|nr:DUF1573 domain-containing protein [Candidatus Omnitrophota bacterium]